MPDDPSGVLDRLRDLESFFVACPLAIVRTDQAGRILFCNPAFEHLFVYTAGESVGLSLKEVVDIDHEPSASIEQPVKGVTIGALRRDQTVVDLEFYTVLQIRNGQRDGAITIFQDITERYRTELSMKLATRAILNAQEREGRRIATELHDNIGQRIALLQFDLERIGRDISDQENVIDRVASLSAQVDGLASDVQSMSHALYSPSPDLLDLEHALRGLCASVRESSKVEIECVSRDVPTTMPREAARALYRVLQEALTNAVKHSGASRIEVDLSGTDEDVQLRVKDFGVGFVPSEVSRAGIGLMTMRERVMMVGGTLDIASAPGAGTEINVRVPFSQEGSTKNTQE